MITTIVVSYAVLSILFLMWVIAVSNGLCPTGRDEVSHNVRREEK
jgi:hypothetical protein